MFEQFDDAPADAILGLNEAFKKDKNPQKINLGVGVYKDANGITPILKTVKKAERAILSAEKSKAYLPITGSADLGQRVLELLFGEDHKLCSSGRAISIQTPGGTGGLRVAADFIRQKFPAKTKIWLSDPTWANHHAIFQAAGLKTSVYPYFDAKQNSLAFEKMMGKITKIPKGDVILLHGCCHNPTGVDPTLSQWKKMGTAIHKKGLIPLVDFAYQGFATGLREDAQGLMNLMRPKMEMMICSSFSKNFGLYNERIGSLTVVASSKAGAEKALGHIKRSIRTNYSNPPTHGAAIVSTILGDKKLRQAWEKELAQMRERIHQMRQMFVDTLSQCGVKGDFSFIEKQRGMFSFSGLSKKQVDRLRKEFSIYIVGSGRINVAGITPKNIKPLCQAIAKVLRQL